MYGSNYSYQALTTKRISTVELENSIIRPKLEVKKTFFMASLVSLLMIISAASFAGSSQPRLAGNNGNANGR
ncbi:MAG: hypothetical protein H7336_07570 [Bacteriovorax sp.]|nr:hypothetical protein [Bacteriovorax sp.]